MCQWKFISWPFDQVVPFVFFEDDVFVRVHTTVVRKGSVFSSPHYFLFRSNCRSRKAILALLIPFSDDKVQQKLEFCIVHSPFLKSRVKSLFVIISIVEFLNQSKETKGEIF
jgi:hypothetical protein